MPAFHIWKRVRVHFMGGLNSFGALKFKTSIKRSTCAIESPCGKLPSVGQCTCLCTVRLHNCMTIHPSAVMRNLTDAHIPISTSKHITQKQYPAIDTFMQTTADNFNTNSYFILQQMTTTTSSACEKDKVKKVHVKKVISALQKLGNYNPQIIRDLQCILKPVISV